MNSRFYVFAMIMAMALINLSLRAFPFVVFKKSDKMPEWLVYLSKVLPSAIMAFLVVYCLKSVDVGNMWPEIVCIAATVILYLKSNNSLLAIAISTLIYMIIVQNVI